MAIFRWRAWRRILNFSEDQLNRPEPGAVLWKWVMDRIKMKRKLVKYFEIVLCTWHITNIHFLSNRNPKFLGHWGIFRYRIVSLPKYCRCIVCCVILQKQNKSSILPLKIIHEDSDMVIIFSLELNVFIRLIGVYINIISGWIDISFICTKICLRVIHS